MERCVCTRNSSCAYREYVHEEPFRFGSPDPCWKMYGYPSRKSASGLVVNTLFCWNVNAPFGRLMYSRLMRSRRISPPNCITCPPLIHVRSSEIVSTVLARYANGSCRSPVVKYPVPVTFVSPFAAVLVEESAYPRPARAGPLVV